MRHGHVDRIDTLNAVMDFDHVIRVDHQGHVHDDVKGVYAPEVTHEYPHGDDIDISGDDAWSLMNGYSGQDRYSGPIMHASEFIGGGMERDILANPGFYVAVVVYDQEDGDDNISGWAVAQRDEDSFPTEIRYESVTAIYGLDNYGGPDSGYLVTAHGVAHGGYGRSLGYVARRGKRWGATREGIGTVKRFHKASESALRSDDAYTYRTRQAAAESLLTAYYEEVN